MEWKVSYLAALHLYSGKNGGLPAGRTSLRSALNKSSSCKVAGEVRSVFKIKLKRLLMALAESTFKKARLFINVTEFSQFPKNKLSVAENLSCFSYHYPKNELPGSEQRMLFYSELGVSQTRKRENIA